MKAEAETVRLPRIGKTGVLYPLFLLLLAFFFYLLLLASLAIAGYGVYRLVLVTPAIVLKTRRAGLWFLFFAYGGILTFGVGLIRAFFARPRGIPFGVPLTRSEHPRVFALTDEVARRVSARPIDEIYLTPENEVEVWEEAALWMPPGFGRRKILLGMGALSFLTLNQLRSVLAHEYGHFSNKDTFFSRFTYRAILSYVELRDQLSGSWIQNLNPLFWLIRIYIRVFDLLAIPCSRRQEFAADRVAVKAYGGEEFRRSCIAMHLDGSFFSQVGLGTAFQMADRGETFTNLYSFVSNARWKIQKDERHRVVEAVKSILSMKTRLFDSHPSLADRLRKQAQSTAVRRLPLPTRPVEPAEGPDAGEPDPRAQPSAAEVLFGENAAAMQRELSDMAGAKLQYVARFIHEHGMPTG